MHDLIDVAGAIVVCTACLTSLIAVWSLLPRPRRVLSLIRGTR